jgi:hypothetical protein
VQCFGNRQCLAWVDIHAMGLERQRFPSTWAVINCTLKPMRTRCLDMVNNEHVPRKPTPASLATGQSDVSCCKETGNTFQSAPSFLTFSQSLLKNWRNNGLPKLWKIPKQHSLFAVTKRVRLSTMSFTIWYDVFACFHVRFISSMRWRSHLENSTTRRRVTIRKDHLKMNRLSNFSLSKMTLHSLCTVAPARSEWTT